MKSFRGAALGLGLFGLSSGFAAAAESQEPMFYTVCQPAAAKASKKQLIGSINLALNADDLAQKNVSAQELETSKRQVYATILSILRRTIVQTPTHELGTTSFVDAVEKEFAQYKSNFLGLTDIRLTLSLNNTFLPAGGCGLPKGYNSAVFNRDLKKYKDTPAAKKAQAEANEIPGYISYCHADGTQTLNKYEIRYQGDVSAETRAKFRANIHTIVSEQTAFLHEVYADQFAKRGALPKTHLTLFLHPYYKEISARINALQSDDGMPTNVALFISIPVSAPGCGFEKTAGVEQWSAHRRAYQEFERQLTAMNLVYAPGSMLPRVTQRGHGPSSAKP